MPQEKALLVYHFVAFLTVAIWGSTFVFTKILLQNDLSPAHIFTLRFIIAYLLMLISCKAREGHFKVFSDSLRDEIIMLLLGITGGSVYFLAENAAMLYTTATNTSLIVCTCPLFAMLLVAIAYRHTEHITKNEIFGSVIACLGMAIVVMNGRFILHLSPLGDMLAFGACLCWAFYSLMAKSILQRYSTIFITRKVFFYGIVTIIPYYIIVPEFPPIEVLLRPDVILTLLFLSVVACMLCYCMWNWVIDKLGVVIANNWIYFNPITTILFAWWLLNEEITIWFLLGTLFVIAGMLLANKKT
jgi:drug/metabolite transporter (DMT)-like permease